MDRWNHNIHYYPLILAEAAPNCALALDVGCGEGILTRQLRSVAKRVVGIDRDPASIEAARAHGGEGIEYILGDFFEYDFEPGSFDLVASVATLHHMDAEAALRRMADLVRPGGVVAVVGLARSSNLSDFAYDIAGAVATRFHKYVLRKRYWEHNAPKVWPPPLTYTQMRDLAARVLPGARFRRHLLWRYSVIWTRPRS